jgi:serine/threonine-protein kinase RsbW
MCAMWQVETLSHQAVLEIPADAAYVQLARLVASGIAGRLDFNIDEIEDLRIGVDECCVALLECAAPASAMRLRYSWGDDEVMLQAMVEAPPHAASPEVASITGQILAAVVDAYRLGRDGAEAYFELRKRRSPIEA